MLGYDYQSPFGQCRQNKLDQRQAWTVLGAEYGEGDVLRWMGVDLGWNVM